MAPVIVKMFARFVRKTMVWFPFEPCFPHTSTFVPDAAIGGEVGAAVALVGATRSELSLGRANLSHGASARVRR